MTRDQVEVEEEEPEALKRDEKDEKMKNALAKERIEETIADWYGTGSWVVEEVQGQERKRNKRHSLRKARNSTSTDRMKYSFRLVQDDLTYCLASDTRETRDKWYTAVSQYSPWTKCNAVPGIGAGAGEVSAMGQAKRTQIESSLEGSGGV